MQQLPMEAAVLIALTVTFWVLLLLCPPFCESVIGFLDKHSMALRSGWAAYVRHWRRPSAEAAARLDTVLEAHAGRYNTTPVCADVPQDPQSIDSGLWSCR